MRGFPSRNGTAARFDMKERHLRGLEDLRILPPHDAVKHGFLEQGKYEDVVALVKLLRDNQWSTQRIRRTFESVRVEQEIYRDLVTARARGEFSGLTPGSREWAESFIETHERLGE